MAFVYGVQLRRDAVYVFDSFDTPIPYSLPAQRHGFETLILTGAAPVHFVRPKLVALAAVAVGKRGRGRRRANQAVPKPSRKHSNPPTQTPPEKARSVGILVGGGGGAMVVRRLGGAGRALLTLPNIRRRASNSWAAVRDTFFSTKEVFENHRIVFTVGTSVASVLTAWAGYSLRHMQQARIDRRLQSIEESLKDNHKVEHEEIKKIVTSSNVSTPACVATALTTTVVGYALGWRGGAWYARRAFRREQHKLMGQIKSQRWQWRPFSKLKNRLRNSRLASKTKSAEADRLSGQSTNVPSGSGAAANASNNAHAAGCT